jgi:hypothetical protein
MSIIFIHNNYNHNNNNNNNNSELDKEQPAGTDRMLVNLAALSKKVSYLHTMSHNDNQ